MAYPSTPITFTTKNAGDPVQPEHVNTLQTEVTALETALLTGGLAHNLLPATDSTRLLGSTAAKWIIAGEQVVPAGVVTLSTAASTVTLPAAGKNVFRLTASTNHTIETVTGAVDGQKILIQFIAEGAARTLTLSTASFRFGTEVSGLTATSSGAMDQVGCIYYGPSSVFTVVAAVKGY